MDVFHGDAWWNFLTQSRQQFIRRFICRIILFLYICYTMKKEKGAVFIFLLQTSLSIYYTTIIFHEDIKLLQNTAFLLVIFRITPPN